MRTRAAIFCLASLAAAAPALAADPPVPIGRDPGGVTIALIGPGADYTDPAIARRLARDGEGEIVGFDLIDNDRRPSDALANGDGKTSAEFNAFVPFAGFGTRIATRLTSETPIASLAVFRADSKNRAALARAIAMTAQTKARIVVLVATENSEPDWKLFQEAAERFKDLLFIVANVGPELGAGEPGPPELANVVVVHRTTYEAGNPRVSFQHFGERAKYADVAVPASLSREESQAVGLLCDWGCGPLPPLVENYAAVSIAARAAQLVAAEPGLKGAALKQRLIGLTVPFPDGVSRTRHGWIPKEN